MEKIWVLQEDVRPADIPKACGLLPAAMPIAAILAWVAVLFAAA